jgi:integrase
MKLTPATIKTLTLPDGVSDKTFFDDDLAGFGVRLRAGGSRKFVVQYDIGTRTKRMTLGAVGALELAAARKSAQQILAGVKLGGDPANERSEARARAGETFGALLFERYLPYKAAQVRPRSFKEIERHLTKYARPLHARPVAAIDRRAVAALVSATAAKAGPAAANYMLGSLSGYFNWLLREGLVDGANPASLVNKAPQGPGRDRLISDSELREIWNALGADEYGDIVRLLGYTAARKTEIGNLMWDEIDFNAAEIRLPANRTKGGRAHVIPLVPRALAILQARPRKGRAYVFGCGKTGFQGWAWRKAALDARIAAARKAVGVSEPMPGFVLHDLRRLYSTVMHDRLNGAPHVIESALGHTIGSAVTATYNKATYVAERRLYAERWAAFIDATVSGKRAAATVVRLHTK